MLKQMKMACLQMVRNAKTYILLSVTVVLSLLVLVLFFSYIDSKIYNDYKELFSLSSNILMTYDDEGYDRIDTVIEMVEENNIDYSSYKYIQCTSRMNQYGNIYCKVAFLPNSEKNIYRPITENISRSNQAWNSVEKVQIIEGKNELIGNEAMINESFYSFLGRPELPFEIQVPLQTENMQMNQTLKIVTICKNGKDEESLFSTDKDGVFCGNAEIYTTIDMLEGLDNNIIQKKYLAWIYSSEANRVSKYIDQVGLVNHAVCNAQDEARCEVLLQKRMKMIIALMMVLILGINMYSCLSNIVNERQFEIGVKRAIGVSGKQIIYQFLIESIVLMIISIVMVINLATIIMCLYKLYQYVNGISWVVYVSNYSMAMFALCAFSIIVGFSIILAYKASHVNIIEQLHKE